MAMPKSRSAASTSATPTSRCRRSARHSRPYGSSMRLPMKPNASPASTVVFRSRFPSAIAAATAPSPVRAPRTFSRSFMTFAGEKKCVPTCVEIKFYGAFVLNRRAEK